MEADIKRKDELMAIEIGEENLTATTMAEVKERELGS